MTAGLIMWADTILRPNGSPLSGSGDTLHGSASSRGTGRRATHIRANSLRSGPSKSLTLEMNVGAGARREASAGDGRERPASLNSRGFK